MFRKGEGTEPWRNTHLGELNRGAIPQCAVRPLLIVMSPPLLCQCGGFSNTAKLLDA